MPKIGVFQPNQRYREIQFLSRIRTYRYATRKENLKTRFALEAQNV